MDQLSDEGPQSWTFFDKIHTLLQVHLEQTLSETYQRWAAPWVEQLVVAGFRRVESPSYRLIGPEAHRVPLQVLLPVHGWRVSSRRACPGLLLRLERKVFFEEEEELLTGKAYLQCRLKKNVRDYLPNDQPLAVDPTSWPSQLAYLLSASREADGPVTAHLFALTDLDGSLLARQEVRD